MGIVRTNFEHALWGDLFALLPGRTSKGVIRRIGRKMGLTRTVEDIHSNATKQKIRDTMVGQPGRFRGHTHTIEARRKISVKNRYARGKSIAEIAERTRISEEEVRKILK